MTPQHERSTLVDTALRAVRAYDSWDIDEIMAPRAEECTHRVLPYRLGRPALDNAQYRAYFAGVMPAFRDFHLEVLDLVADEGSGKVAISARSTAQTVLGPYHNEYMIIFRMTADHRHITAVEEFVDSSYSEDYFARLAAATDAAGSAAPGR